MTTVYKKASLSPAQRKGCM